MSIVLDGTAGITTPEITSAGGPLVVNASAPDNSVVVDASGNVGIGTSSPNTKLHITGNLTIENSSNAPFINFVESGDNTDVKARIEMDQVSGTAGNLLFYTEGGGTLAERARIDSSGNLLVGTTATPNVGVTGQFGFSVSSTEVVISKSGADGLIIRTTSAASNNIRLYNLNSQVGSVSTTTTATAYNTSSDYRLKNTIAPMIGALAKVALLKPCTYKWNADGSDGEGFIAHELAEVAPQCVSGEKDAVNEDGSIKPQGIDTSFLTATLAAALQELHQIVKDQAAEIAELKAINDAQAQTIESLTARVVALENQIV